MKPLTVTGLFAPTFLSEKLPTPLPPSVSTSLPRGASTPLPLRPASVVVSYALSSATMPVTPIGRGVMLAVIPVACSRL